MAKAKRKKQAERCTLAESEMRVLDMLVWIARGASRSDTRRQARMPVKDESGIETPGWGADLCNSAIDRFYSKAIEQVREYAKIEGHDIIGKALLRLDHLYAQSVNITDYKTALAVQKELNELLNFKKVLVKHTHKVKGLSDDAVNAIKSKILGIDDGK